MGPASIQRRPLFEEIRYVHTFCTYTCMYVHFVRVYMYIHFVRVYMYMYVHFVRVYMYVHFVRVYMYVHFVRIHVCILNISCLMSVVL